MNKFAIVLFLLLASGAIAAKSFSITSYHVDATVNSDGSLNVSERLSISFSGAFTEGYRDIPLKGATLTDVRVFDGSAPLPVALSDSGGVRRITWQMSASDEAKTFTIRYRMERQIVKYDDVGVLYYQFIGDQWPVSISDARITILLPQGAKRNETLAWAHGPPQGNVEIRDGRVVMTSDYLPANTYFEGRIAFNSSLVSGQYARVESGNALAGIISEEENAGTRGWRAPCWAAPCLGVFALFLGGGLLYAAWLRYGKEPATEFTGDYYRDIPAPYSPAILGCLLDARGKAPRMEDLTASIVQLAQRGYLSISEQDKESGAVEKLLALNLDKKNKEVVFTLLKEDWSALEDFEQQALGWLFSARPAITFPDMPVHPPERTVSITQLQAKITRAPLAFKQFFEDWQSKVKKKAESYAFHDPVSAKIASLFNGALGGIILIGFLLLFLVPVVLFIVSFVDSVVPCLSFTCAGVLLALVLAAAVSARSFERRTPRGAEEYAKWMGLKKYLSDFSAMRDNPPSAVALWDDYLVYAISLGVADKVIKYMQVKMPAEQQQAYRPRWVGGYSGVSGISALTALSAMNAGMQHSLSRGVASYSSSGHGHGGSFHGSSGGFSGGGGGGGGGGGFR